MAVIGFERAESCMAAPGEQTNAGAGSMRAVRIRMSFQGALRSGAQPGPLPQTSSHPCSRSPGGNGVLIYLIARGGKMQERAAEMRGNNNRNLTRMSGMLRDQESAQRTSWSNCPNYATRESSPRTNSRPKRPRRWADNRYLGQLLDETHVGMARSRPAEG